MEFKTYEKIKIVIKGVTNTGIEELLLKSTIFNNDKKKNKEEVKVLEKKNKEKENKEEVKVLEEVKEYGFGITLTIGDCGENHVGMQKLGVLSDEGFDCEDLYYFTEDSRYLDYVEYYCLGDLLEKKDFNCFDDFDEYYKLNQFMNKQEMKYLCEFMKTLDEDLDDLETITNMFILHNNLNVDNYYKLKIFLRKMKNLDVLNTDILELKKNLNEFKKLDTSNTGVLEFEQFLSEFKESLVSNISDFVLEKFFSKLKKLGVPNVGVIELKTFLSELNKLNVPNAGILVIKNGIERWFDVDKNKLLEEHLSFTWDDKYYDTRRSKVLNKRARHNICYAEESQEADFEDKKGTIISYDDVPLLNHIRTNLKKYLGNKAENLVVEGNLYYDINKCGIGPHGDSERRKVVGLRLGDSFPLCYQWYFKSKRVGKRLRLNLNHGDIYIMSDYAVGHNWKKRNIYTLRHAAGCDKYIK